MSMSTNNGNCPLLSDDDFDYHIQFPRAPPLTSTDLDLDENFWLPKNGGKEILIIMFGWAGSQDKYLEKYSDIYSKRGCIVLRYIVPQKILFFKSWQLPLVGAKIVQLIKDLKLGQHPTFFHVFSNGGTFAYSYTIKELAIRDDVKLDFRGTIFDSAPAPRNLVTIFKAISNILADYHGFRYIIAGFITLIMVLQILMFHVKNVIGYWGGTLLDHQYEDAPHQFWLSRISRMKNHSFLFLYSDADDLISYSNIERFAEILESRQNFVTKSKFIGSPHVQHYRKYPKEYVKQIREFIQEIMNNDQRTGKTVFWREQNTKAINSNEE